MPEGMAVMELSLRQPWEEGSKSHSGERDKHGIGNGDTLESLWCELCDGVECETTAKEGRAKKKSGGVS